MKPSWYLLALTGLFLITQVFAVQAAKPVAVTNVVIPAEQAAALIGPSKPWEWQLAKADYEERLRLAEIARQEEAKRQAEEKTRQEEAAKKVAFVSQAKRYTTPEEIAQIQAMVEARWPGQWSCLDELVSRESGWRVNAYNPSGAYGLPQALPGSKMSSAGADWETNPVTQIAWMLNYISWGAPKYTDACSAVAWQKANGSY
jgi:hypothetical protein